FAPGEAPIVVLIEKPAFAGQLREIVSRSHPKTLDRQIKRRQGYLLRPVCRHHLSLQDLLIGRQVDYELLYVRCRIELLAIHSVSAASVIRHFDDSDGATSAFQQSRGSVYREGH